MLTFVVADASYSDPHAPLDVNAGGDNSGKVASLLVHVVVRTMQHNIRHRITRNDNNVSRRTNVELSERHFYAQGSKSFNRSSKICRDLTYIEMACIRHHRAS
jgi:hypothetical protein